MLILYKSRFILNPVSINCHAFFCFETSFLSFDNLILVNHHVRLKVVWLPTRFADHQAKVGLNIHIVVPTSAV